ncbi:leucine-rich repeat domain-containing protein [Phocaeicola dorei]|nr:leucine-rich repeat domain-containing protein [Phocaeicola dorei]
MILPDDAGTVSANLFKGCINLKEVTLPIDPDIGEAAFEGCKSLTDIHISFYVGSIATNAFRGCRENIRFHADSSGINPKTLKQHIEKELGHSIELYDISGNLVVSTD